MEELFLLACPQVLIVVVDTAVLALLLGVVAVHRLVKQFVVHLLNRFIPVHNIQAAALRVYVFSGETSPVMVEGAGTPHCGNSSFSIARPFSVEVTGAGHGIGFVTFVESNAKALLTDVPSIKRCLCALPGASVCGLGFAASRRCPVQHHLPA